MADLTFADIAVADPVLRADLARLLGTAPARAGRTTWDAGSRRLAGMLLHDARATADDVAARSSGLIRVHVLQALTAALASLAVLALGLAHGVRLARRLASSPASPPASSLVPSPSPSLSPSVEAVQAGTGRPAGDGDAVDPAGDVGELVGLMSVLPRPRRGGRRPAPTAARPAPTGARPSAGAERPARAR